MFAIETMQRLHRRLPLVMILGLLLMAAGGALDVIVHLGPVHDHVHDGFASEHAAHVVGIAGMALVLAGVVAHGVRRHHRPTRTAMEVNDSNAHR